MCIKPVPHCLISIDINFPFHSCGSVVVHFILKFRQAIRGGLVVDFLNEQAQLNKFGRLKVKSIIQISSPTSSSASPTRGKVTDLLNDVKQHFLLEQFRPFN